MRSKILARIELAAILHTHTHASILKPYVAAGIVAADVDAALHNANGGQSLAVAFASAVLQQNKNKRSREEKKKQEMFAKFKDSSCSVAVASRFDAAVGCTPACTALHKLCGFASVALSHSLCTLTAARSPPVRVCVCVCYAHLIFNLLYPNFI